MTRFVLLQQEPVIGVALVSRHDLSRLVSFGLAAAIFAQGSAIADDASRTIRNRSGDGSGDRVRPWTLFGGVGGGYGIVSGSDYAQSPGGPQLMLNGLLAYQTSRWEFDGGAGWMYSRISGQNQASLPIDIRTRAATLDFGARYRLDDQWQIGPAFDLVLGTDAGFGPQVGASQNSALLGLKAVYEMPKRVVKMDLPLRFWGQASTDLNISGRSLWMGLVGVQLGIPLRSSGHGDEGVDAVSVTSAAPVAPARREMRIILDPQKVFFQTNSSALKADVHAILEDVGTVLKKDEDQSAFVEISGHADRRGKYEYNLRLSRKRAESVEKALAAGGADPAHMRVEAFSYSKPLDPAQSRNAWARNRRVELVFQNIRDPEALRAKLQPLMFESPELSN